MTERSFHWSWAITTDDSSQQRSHQNIEFTTTEKSSQQKSHHYQLGSRSYSWGRESPFWVKRFFKWYSSFAVSHSLFDASGWYLPYYLLFLANFFSRSSSTSLYLSSFLLLLFHSLDFFTVYPFLSHSFTVCLNLSSETLYWLSRSQYQLYK